MPKLFERDPNQRTVVGVDPGLSGAIAVVRNGRLIFTCVMPVVKVGKKNEYDIKAIARHLRRFRPDLIILERQQAMPKQGVSSTFKTGYGFGMLCGIVTACSIPLSVVQARAWQKKMFEGMPKQESGTKGNSIIVAQRLYPKVDFRRTPRCKGPDHGKTDAALIATYGYNA